MVFSQKFFDSNFRQLGRSACECWQIHDYPPLLYTPIKSVNARSLAENPVVDYRGFTEFLLENTYLMTIYRNKKHFISECLPKIYLLSKNVGTFCAKKISRYPL